MGCSALSRKPGVVFCEVKALGVWNYLSLADIRGPGSAPAPCDDVFSTLFGRARARGFRATEDDTTKRLCIIFSKNN